ncbi:hypothetical protein CK203_081350 [Vitis vinifera]|uniref:Endonuclease/exonuclease/phosphatase domain-containing protein n=1 Tax=Vitis vinifera TaxID=29760 RepID=A0A438CZJ2_VITVI|nr:hypothetical protein CK203_081350 [Vitis vinifera]
MESELLVVQVEAAIELTPRRWRVTDEALMEEASRLDYGAEGELGRFEPSVGRNRAVSAFGDWSGYSWDSGDAERGNGLALVPVGEDFTSLCEEKSACHIEEGGSGEGWSSSSLARLVELVGWEEGVFSISCRFKNCVDGVVWVFTGVYGPVCSGDREEFWEELEERSKGGGLTASMRRFSEVLEDLELRDYPLRGGPFTWRGGLNNQVQSRLDRFLVTDNWDNLFNGAVQGILPRPVSDHFLVLLEGGGLKRGPSPFKFENIFGSSLETTHRRRTFRRTSGELFFRHRPYQKERLEEISNFCEGTGTKEDPRAGHAPFSGRRLHLTRRRVRAREAFSGDAPPPPASPAADQHPYLPGSPIRALHVPLLGIFVSVSPPNSLSGEVPATFSPPQSLHVPWEVFFYLSGGTTSRSEAVSLFRWCHAAI